MTKENGLTAQFADRFSRLMHDRGLTIDDLVRRSVFLRSTAIRRWLDGNRFPRPRSIVDLAEALTMTPLDLLQGVDVPLRVRVEINAIVNQAAASQTAASDEAVRQHRAK